MSTRAQIVILDEDIDYLGSLTYKKALEHYAHTMIYVHCDGYPEGLGVDLENYLKLDGVRIHDVEYFSAHIIGYISGYDRKHYESSKDFTGYGICKEFHGDLSYYYVIDLYKKKLSCIDTYDGLVYEKTFEEIRGEKDNGMCTS